MYPIRDHLVNSLLRILRASGKNEHYGVKNLKQINEHPNRRKAS
jgi:hypothetical protein